MLIHKRIICCFLISALFLLPLQACTSKDNISVNILTQKKLDSNKINITMSTKYSVYLDAFEVAVEERFPNVNLILVGNYTANYSSEYEQQLANDDLTDIILTWPLDNAARQCEDRLIDLSSMDFTSRYNLSALNGVSQNGKLYYLPGPTQIRGIVYNKTMFKENGWEVPKDFNGFIDLCKEIESSGIRSLQLSFWNPEVLQYAFMAFSYNKSFSTPAAVDAIKEYNEGNGSISDFALPAFDVFQQMIDAGIFKPEDLQVRYPHREKMLFNRQTAMVSDSVSLINSGKKIGFTDELAIMPFFCNGEQNTWGQLTPTQFIGLNKNLTKPENKQKYKIALQIMDYISTFDGQLALANNNASLVSSLKDNPHSSVPEMEDLCDTIARNQYAIFPSLFNAEDALYNGLSGILKGELTQEEAINLIDEQNRNPLLNLHSEIIATATETFSLIDTGNFIADILREHADTDFALFLDNGKDGRFNGLGISGKIYKGDIRESDITQRILPTLQQGEAGYLNIITISGENLVNALEYSLPDENWFYYFSGLKVTQNPAEKLVNRIKTITQINGQPIDHKKLYRVAIMEGSVDSKWIKDIEITHELIKDIVITYVRDKGVITPNNDGRFLLS